MRLVEVTTHNLYFHEQSSIFSIDSHLDYLSTGGGDGVVRLWRVSVGDRSVGSKCVGDKVSVGDSVEGVNSSIDPPTHTLSTLPPPLSYCTALDSSTQIVYISDIHPHGRTVNCVRFNSKGHLASCSDGGKVVVSLSLNGFKVVRDPDGVDIYDLLWTDSFLVVGTSTGIVEVYSIGDNFKKVTSRKVHSDILQSQAYSSSLNLLVTASKDNTCCLLLLDKPFKPLDRLDKFFSTTRGFYRRISFSQDEKFLYLVSCKTNSLVVLSHPFREEHVYRRVGPLDSEVVRVVESDLGRDLGNNLGNNIGNNIGNDLIFVITKKSVYLFSREWVLQGCVENISFKSTTDGAYCCGILFVSSLDGFISSVRV